MYTLVYSINNEEHPETVYVNLTNSCTNSCIFCLRNQKDDVCGAEMWHDDNYTLEDIINSLKKPNRDPRDDFDKPILKSDVLHIEDLKKGMELEGTVRNVVDFGAFIDIGIKNDGLVHISKITDRYIKHPSEVLSVGDIVTCYVDEVFLDKGKVALSLIKNDEK